MNKRIMNLILASIFISPLSHAVTFSGTCSDNGGTIHTNIRLNDVTANTAQQSPGVIIRSFEGREWRIANEFGNHDIYTEQVRVADMARLFDLRVNICEGKSDFSPRRVWALEITK
ncbi:hypothetical protein ACOMICROBIO_LMKGKHOH_03944 [Vibrio sp. B1FIG11]|uniref:hypothetical protein n=1 Tax=Vibrio sp. B1FIG11 TaxID=2751177 RepID=UPI001AF102B9|nr:hypothetical protein [Vibrio sp. B1FIG11]CAD7826917.1 hypothetical protein ACOMICROBIO_LMKGKHOH_03944 [Vibrio sp. B1FIG11]CAE6962125.1 hypothetical protein ACOMICROBIO_LMKGKHOH_03944 [Vibrio sp. B1FIG11]